VRSLRYEVLTPNGGVCERVRAGRGDRDGAMTRGGV